MNTTASVIGRLTEMKISTDFISQVPKKLDENLKWRAKLYGVALKDLPFQAAMRDACSKDPLFWFSGFCFTYDPRIEPFPKLPFILYDFQEEGILDILKAIGSHDLLIEKSRDVGLSWMCVGALTWAWLFRSMQSFLFVSRVEDYVDQAGNPKALMWKMDFLLEHMPKWLMPVGFSWTEHRRKMHRENPENGSVIDGESTNKRVGRGDRRTAILLDEFAAVEHGQSVLNATRDVTRCRLFNSTPEGVANAFYDMTQTGIRKLRIHWSQHPVKSKGLYTTDDAGKLKVLDQGGYPDGYKPILDGKLRSPWYDGECDRATSAREIAQELDIDYLGSGHQFFDNQDSIRQAIRNHARPPILIGDLEYDSLTADPVRFREHDQGMIRLWFLLCRDGKPPLEHRYVVGVDVSAGTGASNSVIVVWDEVTREKVLEYASPYVRPEALARQVVAIARWFGNAKIIWESQGPGRQFGSRVLELGYNRVYLRQREEAISKKVSDIPGWASTKDGKLALLGEYRAAIENDKVVNRSKEALEETLEYVHSQDGGVEHSRSRDRTDPTGARANHGDRVMADALAWHLIVASGSRNRLPRHDEPEVPVGCLIWRNRMREADKQSPNTELEEGWK